MVRGSILHYHVRGRGAAAPKASLFLFSRGVELSSNPMYKAGMGDLRFLPELRFFCKLFKVENIAFSSGNSRLISSLQFAFFLSLCPSLKTD